jgi:hypothetical protein
LPGESAGSFGNQRAGNNEGSGISEEDLRQMQDRAPQRRRARDLRELEAQAETGMIAVLICEL